MLAGPNGPVHFLDTVTICPLESLRTDPRLSTCEAKAEDLNHQEGAGQAYDIIFRLAAVGFWKIWPAKRLQIATVLQYL